ncbi:MAG: hypothetical protein PVG20_05645, partial [Thioalkalispiraceae bacterium]
MSNRIRTYFSLLLVLALALAGCSGSSSTSPTPTQDIYIDATLGNDTTGDGSMALPYQSFAVLATLSYSLPTNIYLKRGEVWYEPLVMPASNINVDMYGTGALPQINGARQVSSWMGPVAGIYSKVVSLGADEALGNLTENGVMMTFQAWDTDTATTFASAPDGSYSYVYATNTLYIKTTATPSLATYLASVQLYGIRAQGRSDITIQNVDIRRTSLHGIEFNNCVRCSVTDSTLQNIGGAVVGPNASAPPDYLYAGNGIDYANSSTDGQVNNVTVTDIFDSCLAVEVYNSNNTAASITLQNTQLARCGFAGVEVSVLDNQGTNTNSAINNVAVSNVTVNSAGKGWSGRRYGTTGHGMRIVADLNAGTMSGISVQTSTVSGSAGDGIQIGGEVGLVNLHRINANGNDGRGINALDATATTLALKLSSSLIYNNTGEGVSYNAPVAAGLQIYHTTFYNNGVINLAVYGASSLADIRNNLFSSSAAMTHLYADTAPASPIIDHNCYTNTTNMFGYLGTAYSTVTNFNLATGFEANGIGGSVGLVNPGADIFTLLVTSDCIHLGD